MTRALAVLAITVPAVLIWTLGHFTAGLIIGGVAVATAQIPRNRLAEAHRGRVHPTTQGQDTPMNPTVYVDIKQSARRWPLGRPQKWYWIALNAGNMRRMGRSTETYTNEADCLAAVQQLFGDGSRVWLRQAERGNVILREMVE